MNDSEDLPREDDPASLDPDVQWRRIYRDEKRHLRLAGTQPDLFDAPPTAYFHPNLPPPVAEDWPLDYEITRFHDLRPGEQAALLTVDPGTPWARSTRKPLTPEEKATMIAGATNWLRIGQRVRVVGTSPSIDGSRERLVGRAGVVWRVCGPPFHDYVHVNLDLVGQERAEKVVFVELRDIIPIED